MCIFNGSIAKILYIFEFFFLKANKQKKEEE